MAGQVQYLLRGPVVLGEHDRSSRLREIALQSGDVLRVRIPPGIDGLLVIGHDEQAAVLLGQQTHDAVLLTIGVLEFVDEKMPVPIPVHGQDVFPVPVEVVNQEDEVIEIDEVVGQKLGLIGAQDVAEAGRQMLVLAHPEIASEA